MANSSLPPDAARIPADPEQDKRLTHSGGRTWLWVLLLLVVFGGAFGIYKFRSHADAQASAKQGQAGPPSIPVLMASVEKRDVPVYLRGLGSVTAFNTVTVKSRVDGQILQVAFREGQFVHAGDLLVQIDPRPFQVALDQMQGQLARDEAQLNLARVDLARYELLWKEGVIALQQVDTQRATLGQFEGVIRTDQAQIDSQKLQLTYCRITAPLGGRVGLRLVDQGNMVHATDANGLLVITQVQPIAVIFTVPEDSLPDVAKQMRQGTLQVEAFSRDDKTKLATGKLITIDNQIDQTTGTIRLKAVFDNNDLSLWPNQFVNARLLLRVRKDATFIPAAALQRGAQGSFVYVIKPDRRAEVRPVQVEFTEGNGAVVSSGLAIGEQVVVDGQEKLQAGSRVEPHMSGESGSRPNPPPQKPTQ